ncbi:hypothetical protein RV02_GL003796 [Enterococcus gilvus]|nr:hypothetical protein RV02_GL003796 [Enterococcus gilvus]
MNINQSFSITYLRIIMAFLAFFDKLKKKLSDTDFIHPNLLKGFVF